MGDASSKSAVHCRNCWKRVAKSATVCPGCGKSIGFRIPIKITLLYLVALALILLLAKVVPLPNTPSGSYVQANLKIQNRDFRAAQHHFESALALSRRNQLTALLPPALANASHNLGHCLDYCGEAGLGENEFRESARAYEQMILPDSSKPASSARSNVQSLDWTIVLQTKLDLAEALYRNKHYDEAAQTYMQFLQRQRRDHPVVMCSMANAFNMTYLGPPAAKHLVICCLNVFESDPDSGSKLLEDALNTISNYQLSSALELFQSLDIVREQAENDFLAGQPENAKRLLKIAELPLTPHQTGLAQENRRQDLEYSKNYLAQLKHMELVDDPAKLYPLVPAAGATEAESAEQSYWSKNYSGAIEGYFQLWQKYPEYEQELLNKGQYAGGVIGAPLGKHMIVSCLHVFDSKQPEGSRLLEKAWELLGSSAYRMPEGCLLEPVQRSAEDYYYNGDLQKARALFSIESKLAETPKLQGLTQEYLAAIANYERKIACKQQGK